MISNKQHSNPNKLPIQVAPASPRGEATPTATQPPLPPTFEPELETTSTQATNMEPQVILTAPTAATITTTTGIRRQHHHHLTPPAPVVARRHLQQQRLDSHHLQQQYHYHHHHHHHHQHHTQRHQHHQCNNNLRQQQLAATITRKLSPNSAGGVRRQLESRPRQRLQQAGRARTGATRQVIRASEYKNLRQSVPSLRRQRDVGKVEVVTEAARYIDHLHKTLIERFVLCGIPDSLKDVLGTDNAAELSSQHIMNLVSSMARRSTPNMGTTSATAIDHQEAGGATRRWPPTASKVGRKTTFAVEPQNRCDQNQKQRLEKQKK